MGISTSIKLVYGHMLSGEDLYTKLGRPDYDNYAHDFDRYEADADAWEDKFEEEEGLYGWGEKLKNRFGLLDLDSFGSLPEWDEQELTYAIFVKSTEITDYNPAFEISTSWLTLPRPPELTELKTAAAELGLTTTPTWIAGWSRF